MEIPRSVRLARLSAMIVLFVLSSVSVGYVAVRVMTDRVLPAEPSDHAPARASTHSQAAIATTAHVSSPFMAYASGGSHVKFDGDDDADDFVAPGRALGRVAGPARPEASSGGGARDFTGHSRAARASSSGSGGFGLSGIGGGVGGYGGVSGTTRRKSTPAAVAHTVVRPVSTSTPAPSKGGKSGGGSGGSASHSSSGSTSGGGSSASSGGGTTTSSPSAPAPSAPAAATGTTVVTLAGTTPVATAGATATATATSTTSSGGSDGGVVALSLPPSGPTGSPAPAPEPISLLLIGSGLGGAFGFRRLFR